MEEKYEHLITAVRKAEILAATEVKMRGSEKKANRNIYDISSIKLPCEQRSLSCMAFSVYEVVRVACQSRSLD